MTIHQFRRQVDGKCAQCGKPFTGIKTKRYCDNACRQAAKYRRFKARESDNAKITLRKESTER